MKYSNLTILFRAALLSAGAMLMPGNAVSAAPNSVHSGNLTVTALTNNILRVDCGAPTATTVETPSDLVNTTVTTLPGDIHVLSTGAGISALVSPDGRLTITDTHNGTTITDPGATSGPDGSRITLYTNATGSFYGAGERGHAADLRGDTLVMYNRQNYGYTANDPRISQMNITMPLFLSSDGFAVVFDDHAAARMVMSNPIEFISENPQPQSYYYVGGVRTLAALQKRLSALLGRQDLAPFWSLGYITSKYGYRTQSETEGVIDTLRRRGYPVDGVVLDLYWYGKEQDMGRLAWDPEQWPDARKMLSGLQKKGVNTIIISQPYVLRNGRGVDNYNDLASRGMFVRDSLGKPHDITIWVGEGGMFDVSNPDTRAWLRQRYKDLTDMGVGGWWPSWL